MIKFGRHKSSSKKWNKKYPRARINRLGGDRIATKVANWFKGNWIDDYYCCSPKWRLLDRFLKTNIGRPVDKVFSEFIKRCDKSMAAEGIKDFFYSEIHEKDFSPNGDYFYISEGILKYKSKNKIKKQKYYSGKIEYNKQHFPKDKHLGYLCENLNSENDIKYIGEFYVTNKPRENFKKKKVYITTLDNFKDKYFYMNNVYLAHNNSDGFSIRRYGYYGDFVGITPHLDLDLKQPEYVYLTTYNKVV